MHYNTNDQILWVINQEVYVKKIEKKHFLYDEINTIRFEISNTMNLFISVTHNIKL